jgi:uncharacterized protein (DUF433 family)
MASVTTTHIWLDDRGVAWIDDSNIKVIEVAMDKRAHGSTAEEMEFQHYGNLSLAQIHAALAYYYDHQKEIDEEIERQAQEYENLRAQALDSPGRKRLRDKGQLP